MKYEDFSRLMHMYGATGNYWEWFKKCMNKMTEDLEYPADILQDGDEIIKNVLQTIHSYNRLTLRKLRELAVSANMSQNFRNKSECIRELIYLKYPPPTSPMQYSIVLASKPLLQRTSVFPRSLHKKQWFDDMKTKVIHHFERFEKMELGELRQVYFELTETPSFLMTRTEILVLLTFHSFFSDASMLQDVQQEEEEEKQPVVAPQKPLKILVWKVDHLADLIELGKQYDDHYEYSFDMKLLSNTVPVLEKINSFIGMENIKEQVMDQMLYFLQFDKKFEYMHTLLTGPPGVGKTELAKVLGELYLSMGILKTNVFKKVVRSDLIAGFVGQTALRTRDIVKSCLGGVMFIDEVYSLGNDSSSSSNGSFSKECIDTLNELLSEEKDNFICIIAGYEDEIEKCFFSQNQGLSSRFPIRFSLKSHTPHELFRILQYKLDKTPWTLSHDFSEQDFIKYTDIVTNGRDIETFLSLVQKIHARRVFMLSQEHKRILTHHDFHGAAEYLRSQRKVEQTFAHFYM
jgi:AAA+ superfamily predicted ATPase